MKKNIIVCGDLHAQWDHLNNLINEENPQSIFQCGDFGYWPKSKKLWYKNCIKNSKTKIYFCDGNHEDHWSLQNLEDNQICKNIYYMKRSSIYFLKDGRSVLFMGGAESIDKKSRSIGFDWFSEETITQKDIWNIPDIPIDVVISHTCPMEFFKKLHIRNHINDPSCEGLSYILNKYHPKLWYFSHFHIYKEGITKDCKWFCLNKSNNFGWYKYLI
jgi:hypothetical protein